MVSVLLKQMGPKNLGSEQQLGQQWRLWLGDRPAGQMCDVKTLYRKFKAVNDQN